LSTDRSAGRLAIDGGAPVRTTFLPFHQPSLAQVLHLISGDTLQRKLTAPNSRLKQCLLDKEMTDDALLDRVFLASLTRRPSAAERSKLIQLLKAPGANREIVYQDLLWGIFNSEEFLYNH